MLLPLIKKTQNILVLGCRLFYTSNGLVKILFLCTFYCMKSYIEGIENIIGFSLEEASIKGMEFTDELLSELHAFASLKKQWDPIADEQALCCFLSLPDILNGSFNTYKAGADLEMHWPGDDQVANALLFHHSILIHDHLKHYVESSIKGYTVGYRFDGLKSWLTRIAQWKPLIMTNRIMILPGDLSYSSRMKKIWDQGLFRKSEELLCYFDQYACDMIESGYSHECIMEINEVGYLLAALSIGKHHNRNLVPFFGIQQKFDLFQKVLTAFVEIAGDHYVRGNQPGQAAVWDTKFSELIVIPRSMHLSSKDIHDFCRHITDGLFENVRSELQQLIFQLRPDDALEPASMRELASILEDRRYQWTAELGKLNFVSTTEERQIRMLLFSEFLQQISNETDDPEQQVDQVIAEALCFARADASPHRLGHYAFAMY